MTWGTRFTIFGAKCFSVILPIVQSKTKQTKQNRTNSNSHTYASLAKSKWWTVFRETKEHSRVAVEAWNDILHKSGPKQLTGQHSKMIAKSDLLRPCSIRSTNYQQRLTSQFEWLITISMRSAFMPRYRKHHSSVVNKRCLATSQKAVTRSEANRKKRWRSRRRHWQALTQSVRVLSDAGVNSNNEWKRRKTHCSHLLHDLVFTHPRW